MRNFRKFQVWEKAHKLNIELYQTAIKFPSIEKYRLTNQLLRASISIPNNIAEGCGRGSDKDFIRFLHIANGSASEVEYLLELLKDLKLIDVKLYENLNIRVIEIKKMLVGLINKVRLRI